MSKRQVRYRLEVDYYDKDYDDKALYISSPIYNKKEGHTEYRKAIKETCIDNPFKPVRAHLWKYCYASNGALTPITILKNY